MAERISFGDTIGVIAPAGVLDPVEIKKSLNFIKSLGFNIKEGSHLYHRLGYLAGSDRDRAGDLMEMMLDKDVKMILCVRGGYGSMRLLPFIDFNAISKNPKIFAGFSDITVLLNAFNQKCGLITLHSPMCNSDFSDEHTLNSFLHTIMKGDSPYILKNPDGYQCYCNFTGKAKGKLVGGNLSLICSLVGTPYEIDLENNILFIEEVNEMPYRIDRLLTQLLLTGKLEKCSGFILGQFTNCSLPHYERSLTLEDVIKDRILTLNKPTLINFMSGHSYPRLTLPIGAQIELDCQNKYINVLEPVLK